MMELMLLTTAKMINKQNEVSSMQLSLSNAIELIYIGLQIHQNGIHNLSKASNSNHSDLILKNKIALLAGDLLLANAQLKIANLR